MGTAGVNGGMVLPYVRTIVTTGTCSLSEAKHLDDYSPGCRVGLLRRLFDFTF
jgi:hypothetical protein